MHRLPRYPVTVGNIANRCSGDDLHHCVIALLHDAQLHEHGCADPIADVALAFTWHLGEFPFQVRDWAPPRYAFIGTWPAPYGTHPPLVVGGLSCTDDPAGQWAVASSANPDTKLTLDELLAELRSTQPKVFIEVGAPGQDVYIAYESPFKGLMTLFKDDKGGPRALALQIRDQYHVDRLLHLQEYPLTVLDDPGEAPFFCPK